MVYGRFSFPHQTIECPRNTHLKRNWNNFPIAPARFPFFYGWILLAAATTATVTSIPGQTMGVGVFTDYLQEALGLTRLQISTAYMFGTIASSFLLPYAGQLVDRLGTRIMVIFSALGLGASLILLGFVDQVAKYLFADTFLFTMLACIFAFFCLRFAGQGCLTMVGRVAVGRWFNYRRGIAAAISGLFVSAAFNGGPYFLNTLVTTLGPREALLTLGLSIGLGMALIGGLFFRDKPEDCGLVMDGITDPEKLKELAQRVPDVKKEFTRSEAIRTRAFWVFAIALSWHGLFITAVVFHLTAIGAEHGLTRNQAYAVFLPIPLISVSTNFIAGWLSNRFRMKFHLCVMMASQFVFTIALHFFGTFEAQLFLIAGLGISGGLFNVILSVAIPRFFGRLHLGGISGLIASIMVFASALGPVYFGTIQALTGTFNHALTLGLAMPILLILAALRTENPQELLD